jgi:mono/diheme cytochrome c family protein
MTALPRQSRRVRQVLRAAAAAFSLLVAPALAQESGSEGVARGKVLFAAGGCANCHTDKKAKGPLAAGGAALKTPFGNFFGPNITPDREHGIGA